MTTHDFSRGPRLVDAEECGRITGITSKGQRNKLIREGRFPEPIRLNAHKRVWVESELYEWNQQQIAARDAGDVPPVERKMNALLKEQAAQRRKAS